MLRGPHRRSGRALTVALTIVLTVTGCSGGGNGQAETLTEDGPNNPNRGPLPTIPGGVELPRAEPVQVLVGTDLTYGTPLPSEQLAADGFAEDPEVAGVLARRVYLRPDARHVADLVVLRINGSELFDLAALDAFHHAALSALAGAKAREEVTQAGRAVVHAAGDLGAAAGFREGDLIVLVTAPTPEAVTDVVTRQLEAMARGEIGTEAPATPLLATPAEAAFVPVPTVTFAPIPPPEQEPGAPEAPAFAGATGVHGRYGVVAGERRSVVWVFTLDPAAYPTAEALDAALPALVAERADGASPTPSEVLDRVVLSSTNDPGQPSARVFRHQGLAILVEGDRPDQLDAVVTAWISALAV